METAEWQLVGWCALVVGVVWMLALGLSDALYRKRGTVRTMVVLGSGGHTAEMLALLRGFELGVYGPRCYVVAATDAMSGQKAEAFEAAAAAAAAGGSAAAAGGSGAAAAGAVAAAAAALTVAGRVGQGAPSSSGGGATPLRRSARKAAAGGRKQGPGMSQGSQQQQVHQQYCVVRIPRSREVGQSFASSIPTTLRALWAAVVVVARQRPDLLLVNGPGTCIPVCAAAFALRLVGVCRGRVVYVESIARVNHLSLSGKLLYRSGMTDAFFVQWEELKEQYPLAELAGRLM